LGPKIAKLSGLKIESREGEGSTFWFYIDTHKGNSFISSPISGQIIDIGNNFSVQNESATQIHNIREGFSHSQVISDHNQGDTNTLTTEGNNSQIGLVGARYKLVRLATIDRKKDVLPDIFVTEEFREATLGEEDQLEEENAMMIKDNNIRANTIDSEISRIEGFRRSQPRLLTSTSRAPNESIILKVPELDFGNLSAIIEDKKLEDIPCTCPMVLYADDDAFNLFTMESLMKGYGLQIAKANHGKEAIDVVKNRILHRCSKGCQTFKLIFMDLSMPVMDGFEATLELKKLMASKAIPEIPIIACTAFVGDDKTEKCYQVGMQGRISKPVSKNKIYDLLKTYKILPIEP